MDVKHKESPNGTEGVDPTTLEFLKDFYHYHDNYQNLSGDPQKISDNPHEIVFTITANVLEENDKGEKTQSKKICTKFYHIPVPLGIDYEIFMKTFFDFLEKSLADAASAAYEQKNDSQSKKYKDHKNE